GVVGHVEWVEFARVGALPAARQVVHAGEAFVRAAGSAGVAASVLAQMGAEVEFYCALGRDANGTAAAGQLAEQGMRMRVAWRDGSTRRAIVLLREGGERAVITIGERLFPCGRDPLGWERLRDTDAVYFTAGDPAALERARSARVVVVTPRAYRAFRPDG